MPFSKEMRPAVKRDFPGLAFGELAAKLGELWRGLEPAAKASYTAGTVPPAQSPAPPAPATAARARPDPGTAVPRASKKRARPIPEDDIIDLT